jgi:integrase
MPTVTFFLKYPDAKADTPVYVRVSEGRHRQLRIATDVKIEPRFWNAARSEARITCPVHLQVNRRINDVRQAIIAHFLSHPAQSWQAAAEKVRELCSAPRPSGSAIERAMEEFIRFKSTHCGDITLGRYRLIERELMAMSPVPTFETMTLSWADKYVQSLIARGVYNSTVNKRVTSLKTFMVWAERRGYHSNPIWRTEKIGPPKPEKVDMIALLPDEVERLERAELTGAQDIVRWMFLFACYTGARWSDVARFDKSQVAGGRWTFSAHKTRKTYRTVTVPLVGWPAGAKKCLDKLNWEIPEITGQLADRVIKDCCRVARINDVVTLRRYSGNREIIIREKKYQLVTFHTARHTCISILLNSGVPQSVVMKLVGITSPKTLMRYLETGVEDMERALIARQDG